MGAADGKVVVIGDTGLKGEPPQGVHFMGLTCTSIRKLEKWYKMIATARRKGPQRNKKKVVYNNYEYNFGQNGSAFLIKYSAPKILRRKTISYCIQ